MSNYYDIDSGDNLFDFDDEVDPFAAPSHTMFNRINADSDSETDSDEAQSETPSFPIQIKNTRRLREALTGNIAAKVLTVLSCMDSVGLNLPLFLDFLSWGDQECVVNARIRYERTTLMVSEELPDILERWRSPPRSTGSTDARAKGAQSVMEKFAFSSVAEVVEKELQGIQGLAACPSDEVSGSDSNFLIKDMTLKLSSPTLSGTPKLWALLEKISRTKEQHRKHTKKPSDLVRFCQCSTFDIVD